MQGTVAPATWGSYEIFFIYAFKFFTEASNHMELGQDSSNRWSPWGLSVAWCGCLNHSQQSNVLVWKPSSLPFLLERFSASFCSSGASLGIRLDFLCNGITTPGAVKNRNSLSKAWTWVGIVKKVDDQYCMFLLFLAFSGGYEFIAT